MLSYSQAALKSLKISAAIVAIDCLGALLLHNSFPAYATFGNLLLVETSALFLLAGVLDFGSSPAFAHLRRSMSAAGESSTQSSRRDPERRALVMAFSGAILFLALVLLALLGSMG